MQLVNISKSDAGSTGMTYEQALSQLQALGFSFQSGQLDLLPVNTPDDEIIEANREQIANLMETDGYGYIEVVNLKTLFKDTAAYIYKPERDEHETRLFTHGSCSLYLRFNGQVLQFTCKAGDLVRLPGQYCYWLEAETDDECQYIHLYSSEACWDEVTSQQSSQPCILQEAG